VAGAIAGRNPDQYQSDLEQFEKYCKVRNVRQITHQYVVGFRDKRLAEGVCPRTVNKQVNALRSCLNKAVEWGRIGSNPIKTIKPLKHDKPLKERRPLAADEFQAIFDNSSTHLRPVWRMFGSTGLRLDELVSLTFDDLDWENRSIVIRAENSKNRKPREIPLDDEMFATIKESYAQARHRRPVLGTTATITAQQAAHFSTEHVFVTKANTPWRNNLLRKFYAICKRAGITDAKPGGTVDIHSLRASFTTLAIDGGANPRAVQAILGHSTLALTMGVYAKATDRAKRDAIGALPFAKITDPEHVVQLRPAASA